MDKKDTLNFNAQPTDGGPDEDTSTETEAGQEGGGLPPIPASEVEQLRAELAEQTRLAAESEDKMLRAAADFSNMRRRNQQTMEQQRQFANQELILKILPIIDNFERALQAADEAHSYEALSEGVSLTLKQLREVLQREGVQPILSLGEIFDPMLHEAVMRVDAEDVEPNTIVEELETGYRLKDQVIRPSRVKVAV